MGGLLDQLESSEVFHVDVEDGIVGFVIEARALWKCGIGVGEDF